jgi:hypothetical protein
VPGEDWRKIAAGNLPPIFARHTTKFSGFSGSSYDFKRKTQIFSRENLGFSLEIWP